MVVWRAEYSVGSQLMDDQHKEIFALIDQLEQLVKNEDGLSSHTKILLNRLVNYAATHFEAEEQLLQQLAYAELGGQQQSHREYVEYLADQMSLAFNEPVRLRDLHRFLKRWWLEHVLVEDMQYKPLLLAHTADLASRDGDTPSGASL